MKQKRDKENAMTETTAAKTEQYENIENNTTMLSEGGRKGRMITNWPN